MAYMQLYRCASRLFHNQRRLFYLSSEIKQNITVTFISDPIYLWANTSQCNKNIIFISDTSVKHF